jgi:hypothetical protein
MRGRRHRYERSGLPRTVAPEFRHTESADLLRGQTVFGGKRAPMHALGRRNIERKVAFGALLVGLALLLWSPRAEAYAWMIRHGYTACASCHVDPSGGGILTAYGRIVATELLAPPILSSEQSEAALKVARVLPLPEWLLVSGDARIAYVSTKIEHVPALRKTFIMRADLEAAVSVAGVVASGSIGYSEEGGLGAALTRAPEKNLVSREHWLGYTIDSDLELLARAGRMNVPFGLRIIEHTAWVRELTSTNINDDQQYGAAVSFAVRPLRVEVMGIAGNFQQRPDDYRERGGSASVEWVPLHTLAIGASTLHTYRKLHPRYLRETYHHVGGLFARWASPWQPLVVLAEADYEFASPKQDDRREGGIGFLQFALEPFRGLHLFVTGEAHNVGVNGPPPSYALWLSPVWHFMPQAELRVDNVYQSLGAETGPVRVLTLLAQVHVYL